MESSHVQSEERMAQEAQVDSAGDRKPSDLESIKVGEDAGAHQRLQAMVQVLQHLRRVLSATLS